MLEALGLDAVVEAVYAAMLADPGAGVAELAEKLARGQDEIRQALDTLADLALLRPSREHPGKMLPVSPAAGLQALILRQEEDLARRRREVESSQAAVARLIADHAASEQPAAATAAVADTERLLGLDAIQAKFEELTLGVKAELASLVPGKALPAETLEAARDLDQVLLDRGVAMRVLYQDAVRNDAATMAYGLWMTARGAQVRTAPTLPSRLLLVDRTTALTPIDPADPGAGALYTSAPGIIDHLTTLFEQIWAGATPLDDARPVASRTGLTSVEQELLRLLAAGSTDEAAANRLGISLRTVRRIMADLMARLEATSRFEAGLKAAKYGWL